MLRREVLNPLFGRVRGQLETVANYRAAIARLDAGVVGAALSGPPSAEVAAFMYKLEGYHRARLIKAFYSALQVDVRLFLVNPPVHVFLTAKITENVELIRTIPARMHESLKQKFVAELDKAPFNRARVTELLRKEYRSSGYNVRRIARDQTTKTIGQLTEIRQRQLGVDAYRWSTAGDERVREEHNANENLVFKWDSPPIGTGHPGSDIQCRCVAFPLVTAADRERLGGT